MNDAKVIERIKALEVNGDITPDAVLDDAKNPKSPLHSHFEWDDTVAAGRYRIEQARALIRSVRIVLVEQKHQISSIAYVRNPDAEPDEQGYTSVVTLRTEKERARRAMENELRRAECALQRAYDLSVSLKLSKEIDAMLAKLRNIVKAA